MWQWVARGNSQQISYIPQTAQHSPFVLMLLCLGNVNYYVCVCARVCAHVCACVHVRVCVRACVCVQVLKLL